jgi:hypothetical protein
MPVEGGRRKLCAGGEGLKFLFLKAALHRHGPVVLHHRGHPQHATEKPDADVCQQMAVEVVHEKSPPGDSLHLGEEVDGLFAVEVMEEECGVDDVNRIIGEGQGQSIANFHPHPRTKGWGQVRIQVRSGMTHRYRIGVEANDLGSAAEPVRPLDQMNEIVPASTADIKHGEVLVLTKQWIQHGIRRRVRAEQSVDQAQIPKRPGQTCVRNGKVVHPFLSL